MNVHISLGRWVEDDIEMWLATSARLEDVCERIHYLSGKFLEVPYKESTLIGDSISEEELVVNFAGIDCFTFLDYVEALRRSSSFADFLEKLKWVRYKTGSVSYKDRNHFFTDWREFSDGSIRDVTHDIGREKTLRIVKSLNLRSDGTFFLDGLPVVARTIEYVPASAIDGAVLDALSTGDYIGIYTETDGLDVSHVGIAIKHDDGTYLRHASSAAFCHKVTDRLLMSYVKEKPGIVVLRPQSFTFKVLNGTI